MPKVSRVSSRPPDVDKFSPTPIKIYQVKVTLDFWYVRKIVVL